MLLALNPRALGLRSSVATIRRWMTADSCLLCSERRYDTFHQLGINKPLARLRQLPVRLRLLRLRLIQATAQLWCETWRR